MCKQYLSRSSYLGVAILLFVLCIDLITWCIYDPIKLLVCDILSIGLKFWFILLSICRYYWREDAIHAKGLTGERYNTNLSTYPIQLTKIIIHSLVTLNSITKLRVSMARCQGQALATVSCILGLSSWVIDPSLPPQQPHFGFFNSDMARDPGSNFVKRLLDDFTHFKFKRFVWHILQSAPAVNLELSLWFIILAGMAHCCGTVIQFHHVIVIICFDLSSLIIGGIFWIFQVPTKPFPGYRYMTRGHLAFHCVVTACAGCFLCCVQISGCHHLLFTGMVAAHSLACALQFLETEACEYVPSKLRLKVVTTSMWWDCFIYICIFVATMTQIASGANMKPFNKAVEALARFQNSQCEMLIGQDLHCVTALNQCVTAINNVTKVYNQSANPLPRFDLNGQLNLAGQLVTREDQAGKGVFDRVTGELNQHVQTFFNPSTPLAPFTEAYESFRPACVDAFKRFEHGIDQPDRHRQCRKARDEFLEGFDEFVKDFNERAIDIWFIVPLVALPTICHLPYFGQQVFILNSQAYWRDEWVKFGEKFFDNKYLITRGIVEWILTRYPFPFIAASFLCVRILGGWTTASNKQSIVLTILCMTMMFVIASTFHGIPKSATADSDPEDIYFEYTHTDDSLADTSRSKNAPKVSMKVPGANSSLRTAPKLDTTIPGVSDLEAPESSSVATTKSSTSASHTQRRTVVCSPIVGYSTQSSAPELVPGPLSSGTTSEPNVSNVQVTPASFARGARKSAREARKSARKSENANL